MDASEKYKVEDEKSVVEKPAMAYGLSSQTDITDISMLDMNKVYTC